MGYTKIEYLDIGCNMSIIKNGNLFPGWIEIAVFDLVLATDAFGLGLRSGLDAHLLKEFSGLVAEPLEDVDAVNQQIEFPLVFRVAFYLGYAVLG